MSVLHGAPPEINMPLSPMRVWEAISQAQGASPKGGVSA